MYKIIGGDGSEYGPVSAGELRQWIAEGRVNAQTRVQIGGAGDWRLLGELPEFGLAMSATPLPLPPSPPAPVPVYLKVFSILNMVFGGLGLLCAPLSFVAIPMALKTLGHNPLMKGWLIFSSVWGLIGAGVLLASGIGLWKLKAWARKLAVGYAALAIVLGLVGMGIIVTSFGAGAGMRGPERIGGIVGGVGGFAVGLVYNLLLIAFLSKGSAKQATGEMQ